MADSITITAGKARIDKDPNAILDYEWDWSAWLAAHTPADTIVAADVLVSGCTLVTPAQITSGGQRVRAWLSGGTVGAPASATCRITTSAGRVDDRTLYLTIKER